MILKKITRKLVRVILSYLSLLTFRNNDKLIFGAWFGNKFLDNSKYLYKYINNISGLRNIWITKNIDIYEKLKADGYEVYMNNSLKGIYHQLTTSKYFTRTGKSDVSYYLLSGAEHIELWHGIPLKKIMYDDKISNDHNLMEEKKLHRRIINWPENHKMKVVSTSDKITEIYEGAFNVNKYKILQLGQPRNDVFFDENLEDKDFPLEYKNNKTILYMPTHRKEGRIKFDIDEILDLKEINELCKKNNVLFLIKKHYYHSNEKINLDDFSNVKDITNEDYDSQMLLKYTDILITDYSSCYIDYLLLDRPIIFYNFDYDDYLKTDREMYFDYEYVTPGNKVKTYKELEKEIIYLLSNNDLYLEQRKKIRNLFYDIDNQNIVSNKIIETLFK